MAYEYPVKWITNAMRGAPQISGTAGTLIGALDAFLLTGWGTATAISVTVADGVGTATFTEGSYFEDGAVVLIGGVTSPAALNGEARVLSHTNTSITFETDAVDGTATTSGSITFKYAPVGGWEKAFSGTNLAAYRSTDPQSPGHFLRVADTGTTAARVVGYESMTDVNTGSGPFPTAAMISGGAYLPKSNSANATAVRYVLVADSRALLHSIFPGTSSNPIYLVSNVHGFGDPVAAAPSGDTWGTFLSASGSASSPSQEGSLSGGGVSSSGNGFSVLPRGFSGLGSAIFVDPRPFCGAPTGSSGNDAFLGAAPSVVDGQIKLSKMFLREQSTVSPPRLVVPGVAYVPQTGLINAVSVGDILVGDGEFSGRKLLAVGVGSNFNTVPSGLVFIDLTGPWRE